ncbi:GNAT family N-acetyltransferase [Nonomuraea sp. CA-218870]|uniref:GNAT family N-acetyltransferase n=1 Tax=Nonomuraea sp. CA-218870 TaxID=3239998 RepID=UPI003D91BB0C
MTSHESGHESGRPGPASSPVAGVEAVRVLRKLRGADLARAREVARAALTHDADEAGALVERLAAPPADRRWAALVDGGGFAMASMSTADPAVGHVDLLAVHPGHQGRGHGRALLRAAEGWLRREGAREVRLAGNPPCYAWPGVDVRYTPAACLAESLGYERYRTAWNMTADLHTDLHTDLDTDLDVSADVARLAGLGIEVRAAGDDRGRVAEFAREHWNAAWAWEAAHAAGVHYAEREGRVLAFAAWGTRPSWFGPMGTAPEARGTGLGRVLLRRCLADMRAAGQRTAQIGWVGPLRFYARAVGARAERVFWLYGRELA